MISTAISPARCLLPLEGAGAPAVRANTLSLTCQFVTDAHGVQEQLCMTTWRKEGRIALHISIGPAGQAAVRVKPQSRKVVQCLPSKSSGGNSWQLRKHDTDIWARDNLAMHKVACQTFKSPGSATPGSCILRLCYASQTDSDNTNAVLSRHLEIAGTSSNRPVLIGGGAGA